MLNGQPFEVANPKIVKINGKERVQIIDYEGFKQARAEYFDRMLKEK